MDWRQLRRGLARYLDYDVKRQALSREVSRKEREKADELELKTRLDAKKLQQNALLDLAKLQTPAGVEAQSRLLPGFDKGKAEDFLRAKTFLPTTLREGQYGQSSELGGKVGLSPFLPSEKERAQIEADKALQEARKAQGDLAQARIGRVKLEQQRIRQKLKETDRMLAGGVAKISELKTIYNAMSDQADQLRDDMRKIAEDLTIDPETAATEVDELRSDLENLMRRQSFIIELMERYKIPEQEKRPQMPGMPNIGPLTKQGEYRPGQRPKLDY